MDRILRSVAFISLLVLPPALITQTARPARAGGLDAAETASFREAKQLYKSGKYEEAAALFSRLSAAHPEMPILARDAGAAYYYLQRPEPALSNFREYLHTQKKIAVEDRREVDRWVAEMEQLRAQNTTKPTDAQTPSTNPAGSHPVDLRLGPGGSPPAAPGAFPNAAASPRKDGQMSAPSFQPGPGQAGQYPAQPDGQPNLQQPYPGQYQTPPPTGAPGQAPYPYAYPYPYANQPPQSQTPPSPLQPQAQSQPAAGLATESGGEASSGSGNLPWIIGGAGVAGLALGGVFTYLYQSAFSDTQKQYNPSRESSGKTYSALQFVCYGVGAAGVVTAIILATRTDSHPSKGTVALVPSLGPRSAGVLLDLTY